MKTKFFPKLILLFVLALFLNSCTADEITPSKTQNTSDSSLKTGEPIVVKPK